MSSTVLLLSSSKIIKKKYAARFVFVVQLASLVEEGCIAPCETFQNVYYRARSIAEENDFERHILNCACRCESEVNFLYAACVCINT